jgi:GDPmannose 4,6-dehydratase
MDTTQKVALIFGITGQVGSYLAELLLSKGYRVIGLIRKTSVVLPPKYLSPDCRLCQAASSEMFGNAQEVPQNERTPFNPLNPYAASKLYTHNITLVYRESFGLFIACRMPFITQKVTYGAACIKSNRQNSPMLSETVTAIVKDGKTLTPLRVRIVN